jgi:integrase
LDALKVNLKRLRTDAEVAGQRHGVKVFTVEQLTLIYRHATDFERLLLLLGLNAAMAQAEITSLRWDELEQDPPTIKRIRRKSSVYAEFRLWPETAKALDWWRRVRPTQGDLVMLTDKHRSYTRQRLSNAWSNLKQRIERETSQPVDWWLPFKHLRKTAAQFVREKSDGEIAGVFLSHGQPVESDALADHYSNRPFGKVPEALMEVHTALKPMFKAQPLAFGSEVLGRSAHRQQQTAKT